MNSIKWMAAIVDRDKGNRAAFILHEHHFEILLAVRGHGTTSSAIMDCLGLDEPEEDLILEVATDIDAHQAMEALKREMEFGKPGYGVAFSIPLSRTNTATPNFLKDWDTPRTQITACTKEDTSMPDSKHYELTVTVISTDLSTSVTEAVRRAGYHGDTFVEAREVGTDEEKKFFGLTLSQKKAILLILTPASGKQPILKAICRTVLQEAGGHVIASSMSIDEMQGISGQDLINRPGE